MKNIRTKLILVLLICNAFFIAFFLMYGSKYALNLMTEQEAKTQLMKINGVGEIKAERIAEHRKEIKNIKDLDTEDIKYSRYFCIRRWDMRSDVMYTMFGVSLVIGVLGSLWLQIWFKAKGIKIINNKYVILGDKEGGK